MCRILVYILKAILIRETKKVVQLLIQTSVWGASWDIIGLLMRLSGDAWSKYAQFGVNDGHIFNKQWSMCRILVYILKAILIRETKKVVQLLIQTSVWGTSWDRIGLFMRRSGDVWSK
jgi:hypothetical protein